MDSIDDDDDSPATLRGQTVAGRYQILDLIGQGGSGRVYTAAQLGLDRRVAVKFIRKDRRDPVTAQRFEREARAAGRIASPHVVTLYDFGRDGEDLYIAMELLEGKSLSQRLRDGPPLPLPEAIATAAAIAKGLRAAHEAGVLHRDLKPGNVFLCSDGVVKVLDFGIAKLVDDDGQGELTAVNRILGTPVYMSPEAVTRKPLGPTTDLYALGLMLFEMIVGEPPFRSGNAMQTLQKQVTMPAPRITAAAPWVAVPEALDELVDELLRKDPAERPPDAASVVARLEAIGKQLERVENSAVLRVGAERTAIDIRAPRPPDSEEPRVSEPAPAPSAPRWTGGDPSTPMGRGETSLDDATEVWSGRPWERDPSIPRPVAPPPPPDSDSYTPELSGPLPGSGELGPPVLLSPPPAPASVPPPAAAPMGAPAPFREAPRPAPAASTGRSLVLAAVVTGVLVFSAVLLIRFFLL